MTYETYCCLQVEEVIEDPIIPFFSKATLKSRGWTNKMIEVYLGCPDFLLSNPRNYKHPIQCFCQERTLQAESLEEFAQDLEYKNKIREKVLATRKKNNIPTAYDNFVKRFVQKVEEMDLIKKRYPKHISKFIDILGLSITPSVYKQLVSTLVDFKENNTSNPIVEALFLKDLFIVEGPPSEFFGQTPKFYVISRNKLSHIHKKFSYLLE